MLTNFQLKIYNFLFSNLYFRTYLRVPKSKIIFQINLPDKNGMVFIIESNSYKQSVGRK